MCVCYDNLLLDVRYFDQKNSMLGGFSIVDPKRKRKKKSNRVEVRVVEAKSAQTIVHHHQRAFPSHLTLHALNLITITIITNQIIVIIIVKIMLKMITPLAIIIIIIILVAVVFRLVLLLQAISYTQAQLMVSIRTATQLQQLQARQALSRRYKHNRQLLNCHPHRHPLAVHEPLHPL